jgi:sulfopyruvate decarboxylase TPP-binding subunit
MARGLQHRQSLQITVTTWHVDNPAVGVKFRRSKDDRETRQSSRKGRTRMAVAEEKTSPEATEKSWHGVVLQTLKRNDIRLVPYVPDRVLTTLIRNLHADPFFTTFPTAREEEAVGIVSGAWMGGMRGAVLMQTSGFATLANILASLAVPYQIPLIMFVSERGTLGEFNYGQSLVCRTMRPVLDSLAMDHHTATRLDELEFIIDRSI